MQFTKAINENMCLCVERKREKVMIFYFLFKLNDTPVTGLKIGLTWASSHDAALYLE